MLEAAVRTSRVLVTIIDPYTFESEWVVKENAWAEQYGRPIITLYDGDTHLSFPILIPTLMAMLASLQL